MLESCCVSDAPDPSEERRAAAVDADAAERWRTWIEGSIRDDALRLHQQRVVWNGMRQVIRENRDLPRESVLWEYLFDTYAVAQATTVRQSAETGDEVVSLGRLLREIGSGDQGAVTREWWMSRWSESSWTGRGSATDIFDGLAGGGAPAFPWQTARRDLRDLRASAATVERWVDHCVARRGKRGLDPDPGLSVRDLHDAITLVLGLYIHYSVLLRRPPDAALSEIEMETSNWRDPLEMAWIA